MFVFDGGVIQGGGGGGGTDPLAPSRLIYGGTWEGLVGVVGGIPTTRTQSGSTIAAYTGTAGTINTAITNAASNTYVQLGAGTFILSSDILIAKSNVTLRGSVDGNGVPTTIVQDSSVQIYSTGWDTSNAAACTNVNITAGLSRGSRTVTVAASPSGRPVSGNLMIISAPPNLPTLSPDQGYSLWHTTNPFTQLVIVASVSGNDITFDPPLNADYLSGTCKVSWRATSASISRSGVENISFTTTNVNGSSAYIKFQGTIECWAKNCKTNNIAAGQNHIYPYVNFRTEIRHCDCSHMADLTNSTYCLQPIHCSNMLIEDNYFHNCPNVMPMVGLSGSVFSYNYINDLPYSPSNWLSQIVFFHGSHNHYNLIEGNWLAASYNDASESGQFAHSRNTTYFRNRMRGWDATGPKTSNTHTVTTEDHHDNITIAGNVLGENGYHTTYDGQILSFEATSLATRALIANYNTVNDAIPAGEALGVGEALVTSYVHSTKPSWFGSLAWPMVTPTNYTQSNNSDNLPAGYRASHSGADPP